MIGIYFSGTGNTKYCVEQFVQELDTSAHCCSIEEDTAAEEIRKNDFLILAYPIYYSNLPKIMRDFLMVHGADFAGKKVFLLATMGLFSGDGTGCAARLLQKYGAEIVGGLHLKMPDCIGDEKALKKSIEENKQLVREAKVKLVDAARRMKSGRPTRDGLGALSHLAGLFGQRLWFYNKTKHYSDRLKIDTDKCVGCGQCAKLCPMKNLHIIQGKAQADNKCTLCYRCISHCPHQAMTLLGNTVQEQCRIEKYL